MEIRKVASRLKKYGLECVASTEDEVFIETHKMVKPGQQSFVPACLYVGYVSELPDEVFGDGPSNIICIEDRPLPSGFVSHGRMNLYLAPKGVNQFDILNTIADIMIDEASIVAGMRRLIDALYTGLGLQGIVDIAAEVLGNPVFVNDGSFKILAMSSSSRFENATLEEERTTGFVLEENVEAMRQDGVIAQGANRRKGILRIKRRSRDEEWLFRDVKLNGVNVATIAVVDNNQPFRSGFDEELLDRLSKVVALELEKNEFFKDDRSVMFEYFVGDLLSGKLHNEQTIERRRRIIGWDTYAWYGAFVIVDPEGGIARDRSSRLISIVQGVLPDCRWSMRQHNLVLLLSRPEKKLLTKKELEQLEMFLSSNGLVCGASEPFERLADAARYYKQAYRTAEAAVTVGADTGRVHKYAHMVPYYIAQSVLKRNDLDDFTPESVRVLITYDGKNGTELVATLEAYLLYVEDTEAAAKALHVHRNTLLYRVNKIKELTGIDFHDGDERFVIQLFFKLREYQRAAWTSFAKE